MLGVLAYRVSQFDYEMANFDPYEILGIPLGASVQQVKKAYKQLSLIYHPDKATGNEKMFMKLTKGDTFFLIFAAFFFFFLLTEFIFVMASHFSPTKIFCKF